MDLKHAIEMLEGLINNPHHGLPEDVFLFISGITPTINVDLLIKDTNKRTLLTWREDLFGNIGWHIPGGVIRFKETFADRIHAVAKNELGANIVFDLVPIAVHEIIHPERRTRGHSISLLFKCSLLTLPAEDMRYNKIGNPTTNQWAWHDSMPDDIVYVQRIYKKFISNTFS
jgi:colanic acid biosynthesis protein WcaH